MNIRITPNQLFGTVKAPTSKSVAHRMLICAALADKKSVIQINKSSDDINATADCLCKLGAKIEIEGSSWVVTPISAPASGVTLDCGESGSTLRFLIPVVCALGIDATFTGHGRLPSRPVDTLLSCLSSHGVQASMDFPIKVSGKLKAGDYTISGSISSQYITGLMLALPMCEGNSTIKVIPPVESKPYIDITSSVLEEFGVKITEYSNMYSINTCTYKGGKFCAEGDWSNSSFWLAAGVPVSNLSMSSVQGDKKIIDVIRSFSSDIKFENNIIMADFSKATATEIDASDIPDLVPIIAVIASTAKGTTKIVNAHRLRLKESDRLESTTQMIANLGGKIVQTEDGLIIDGVSSLKGGTVDSFNDHRIVMAAAIAAQKCKNPVIIKDAQAVNKSYPSFFEEYKALGGIADVM